MLWREWHRSRPSLWMTILVALLGGTTGLACCIGAFVVWRDGVVAFGVPGPAQLAGTFGYLIQLILGLVMLSVLAPMSLSEERQRGSLDVLIATPLSTWAIVLGKWWGTFRLVPVLAIGPGLMAFALATARRAAVPPVPAGSPPRRRLRISDLWGRLVRCNDPRAWRGDDQYRPGARDLDEATGPGHCHERLRFRVGRGRLANFRLEHLRIRPRPVLAQPHRCRGLHGRRTCLSLCRSPTRSLVDRFLGCRRRRVRHRTLVAHLHAHSTCGLGRIPENPRTSPVLADVIAVLGGTTAASCLYIAITIWVLGVDSHGLNSDDASRCPVLYPARPARVVVALGGCAAVDLCEAEAGPPRHFGQIAPLRPIDRPDRMVAIVPPAVASGCRTQPDRTRLGHGSDNRSGRAEVYAGRDRRRPDAAPFRRAARETRPAQSGGGHEDDNALGTAPRRPPLDSRNARHDDPCLRRGDDRMPAWPWAPGSSAEPGPSPSASAFSCWLPLSGHARYVSTFHSARHARTSIGGHWWVGRVDALARR